MRAGVGRAPRCYLESSAADCPPREGSPHRLLSPECFSQLAPPSQAAASAAHGPILKRGSHPSLPARVSRRPHLAGLRGGGGSERGDNCSLTGIEEGGAEGGVPPCSSAAAEALRPRRSLGIETQSDCRGRAPEARRAELKLEADLTLK